MIRKGCSAMPLPERRGPRCRGPDCNTENGPCHPGCTPDAGTAETQEPTQPTSESPGAQWRDSLRQFVTWVLLVASVVAALSTIADGVSVLVELISTL